MIIIQNLIEEVEERFADTPTPVLVNLVTEKVNNAIVEDVENESALLMDITKILKTCGIEKCDVKEYVFRLACKLPVHWWDTYGLDSVMSAAWLCLYTNGAKLEPTGYMLDLMRNFLEDRSLLYDILNNELIDLDLFRESTGSGSLLRERVYSKFADIPTQEITSKEEEHIRMQIKELDTTVDMILMRALDIPKSWLVQYGISSIAQAAWLMTQVYTKGRLTENIIRRLHANDSLYDISTECDMFIGLCVQHNLSANIEGFASKDHEAVNRLTYVKGYAHATYGNDGFYGLAHVLLDAVFYDTNNENVSVIDTMYCYVEYMLSDI